MLIATWLVVAKMLVGRRRGGDSGWRGVKGDEQGQGLGTKSLDIGVELGESPQTIPAFREELIGHADIDLDFWAVLKTGAVVPRRAGRTLVDWDCGFLKVVYRRASLRFIM